MQRLRHTEENDSGRLLERRGGDKHPPGPRDCATEGEGAETRWSERVSARQYLSLILSFLCFFFFFYLIQCFTYPKGREVIIQHTFV